MKIGPRCRLQKRPSGSYRVGFYRAKENRYKWIALQTTHKARATAKAYDLYERWSRGEFDPWSEGYKVASIEEAINHYLSERGPEIKDKGASNVRRFRKLCKEKKVEWIVDLTPPLIRSYVYSYKNQQTQRSTYNYLSAIISWLAEQGYFPANPMDQVAKPKQPVRTPKYWIETDLEKFFNAAEYRAGQPKYAKNLKYPRWYIDAFYFYLYTGARAAEGANARWSDVLDDRIIIRGLKKSEDRPVSLALAKPLLDRLEADTRLSADPNEHILKAGDGFSPMSAGYCGKVFSKIAKMARLENIGLHGLRHTFAVRMIRAGVSMRSVQIMLGHEDISTTQIYTALTAEDVMEDVKKAHDE